MKPSVISAIAVTVIVALGVLLYFLSAERTVEESSSNTTPSSVNEPATENTGEESEQDSASLESYTSAEVANHDTENDCWTIIDDMVYDITSYVPRHPGGDEILRACGTDGSSLFNERQTDSGEDVGSGAPHSSNAKSQLESLKIGQLAN